MTRHEQSQVKQCIDRVGPSRLQGLVVDKGMVWIGPGTAPQAAWTALWVILSSVMDDILGMHIGRDAGENGPRVTLAFVCITISASPPEYPSHCLPSPPSLPTQTPGRRRLYLPPAVACITPNGCLHHPYCDLHLPRRCRDH